MTPLLTYDQMVGALCLWREARSCNRQEKEAVWSVLLNRAKDKSGRWPPNIPGVVLQYHQFSSFNMDAKPDLGKNIYHCDPNAAKWPLPPPTGNASDWDSWQECLSVVVTPLMVDPTKGATNYESEPAGYLPPWATPQHLLTQIGPFRFYRGV